ncbi:hypothetical protein ACFQXA_36375 [Nocardiopsis composta]
MRREVLGWLQTALGCALGAAALGGLILFTGDPERTAVLNGFFTPLAIVMFWNTVIAVWGIVEALSGGSGSGGERSEQPAPVAAAPVPAAPAPDPAAARPSAGPGAGAEPGPAAESGPRTERWGRPPHAGRAVCCSSSPPHRSARRACCRCSAGRGSPRPRRSSWSRPAWVLRCSPGG